MRLGIVADIHEEIACLERALAEFRARGVDQVVNLGDACDTFGAGGRATETVDLLSRAGAIGVWGNHDYGLCRDVSEKLRRASSPMVLNYMATMQPQWVIAGCRFSHVEPWLDPNKVENLWYFDGPPDDPAKAERSFAAAPERFLFVGHFHRWLAVTPERRLNWAGADPLELAGAARCLIVVAPVVSGWCAIFDAAAARLEPVRCTA